MFRQVFQFSKARLYTAARAIEESGALIRSASVDTRLDPRRTKNLDVRRVALVMLWQHRRANQFETNSRKRDAFEARRSSRMPAQDQRRDLISVTIAVIVAIAGTFFLWADLSSDPRGRGDGMITSAVLERAGVIVTPSEPPSHLVAPATVAASQPSTIGRVRP